MNFKSIKICLLLSVISIAASGCGGGAGGGGGGSSDSGKSAKTGVRVLHGILDSSPVDVYSSASGGKVSENIHFADSTFYARLPEGAQVISLNAAQSTTGVFNGQLTVTANQHSSILYYGSEESFGINGRIIIDDAGEIPTGTSAVKVAHALVGASKLTAAFGAQTVSEAVSYGTASAYVYVSPGLQTFSAKRTSDNSLVINESYQLQSGKAYTVFVSGEIDYFVVSRLLED